MKKRERKQPKQSCCENKFVEQLIFKLYSKQLMLSSIKFYCPFHKLNAIGCQSNYSKLVCSIFQRFK